MSELRSHYINSRASRVRVSPNQRKCHAKVGRLRLSSEEEATRNVMGRMANYLEGWMARPICMCGQDSTTAG